MEFDPVMYFNHPRNTAASLFVRQQLSAEEEELRRIRRERINNYTIDSLLIQFQNLRISDDLPKLTIRFNIRTHTLHQRRTQILGQQIHLKSLCLTVDPSVYMSHDLFYSNLQGSLNQQGDWGEVFDRDFRYTVLHDMVLKIQELVDHESNKGLNNMEVYGVVCVFIVRHNNNSDPPQEELLPVPGLSMGGGGGGGMVPAAQSSLQLLQETEVDPLVFRVVLHLWFLLKLW